MRPKLSDGDREAALEFLKEYVSVTPRFDGGQPLAAWRTTHSEVAQKNWRNVWSSVLAEAEKLGWIICVGRQAPKSKQSHTRTLALWQSRKVKVPMGSETVAQEYIAQVKKQVALREIDLTQALWKVYGYAMESK